MFFFSGSSARDRDRDCKHADIDGDSDDEDDDDDNEDDDTCDEELMTERLRECIALLDRDSDKEGGIECRLIDIHAMSMHIHACVFIHVCVRMCACLCTCGMLAALFLSTA